MHCGCKCGGINSQLLCSAVMTDSSRVTRLWVGVHVLSFGLCADTSPHHITAHPYMCSHDVLGSLVTHCRAFLS